ncbi:hypothetical protein K458DRAFT_389991 [Lentithecium fluviatile CBS 122367]|uniref:Uncharacterized protein n=1 Tax=Lentithecium fluviatile CBS 122367 TaxID=1168545 RepID=A0A6G1IYP8_9PLEO|nr:hypothetical protein K458DRAFT_389991 [Lentithecium fluviatile CBS 122367]
MPSTPNYHRSSDSNVDFEHAATIEVEVGFCGRLDGQREELIDRLSGIARRRTELLEEMRELEWKESGVLARLVNTLRPCKCKRRRVGFCLLKPQLHPVLPKSTPSAAKTRGPREPNRIAERAAVTTSKLPSIRAAQDQAESPTKRDIACIDTRAELHPNGHLGSGTMPLRGTQSMRISMNFGDGVENGNDNGKEGGGEKRDTVRVT